MKILILGAGKMGSFFSDVLSFEHEVAIYDTDPQRLRFTFNTQRMTTMEEIEAFKPELLINAATVKYTIPAFESVLPHIPESCIISDIASVKTGLPEFYKKAKRSFVSTHPMFGPTFANLGSLSEENAIIITESDHLGKVFFKDLYSRLHLNIFEYTFKQHDETIAYSLSIPFVSTMVFAATMKHQDAPGTTFKRHMNIARGLFSEDDYLLTEILFNPHTGEQLEKIQEQLSTLQNIINLSCNMDKFRYLPGVTTEAKLGEHLLKGNADMAMEEQAARSNYEGIGTDYIKKHGGMFHAFGYTSGSQEELEPIYRGKELPDPNYKQTCSFKVWIYKGNPYDNYTLTLLATESKMDALKSAMGISNWSECKQLDIQCRVPTLWDWLPEYGSIEELNDLVTEHCQSMENQQAPVLEM